MVEGRIGYRYAKSLFSLAQEEKIVNEVKEDMTLLRDTCQESKELRNFLQSPLISLSKKTGHASDPVQGKAENRFFPQLG